VDKRFTNPNSAVHAKNQAAINTGYAEVETGQLSHHQRPQANPLNPNQPTAPTAYGGPPVPGSQIEGRSGGKMSNFVKKMKDGALAPAPERTDGRTTGPLKVVNE
jgi:hypothetical protein